METHPWHLSYGLFIQLKYNIAGFHFDVVAVVIIFGECEAAQHILLC